MNTPALALPTVTVRPGEDTHCPCGKRFWPWEPLPGATGAVRVRVKCRGCKSLVWVTLELSAA